MAFLTIISALLGPVITAVSALLKDTSVVLILLGCSLGFHFGDEYGRWRQTRADAASVRSGGGNVQPAPRVRPIRDLIHAVVGDPPEAERRMTGHDVVRFGIGGSRHHRGDCNCEVFGLARRRRLNMTLIDWILGFAANRGLGHLPARQPLRARGRP